MRGLVLAGASAVVLAAAANPALAGGGARVVGECTRSQVRPTEVILRCADANAALVNLRWQDFGGATAHARGTYAFNDCSPSCVAGTVHSYPVALVFSRARRCPDGRRDYRRVVGRYSSGRRPRGTLGRAGRPGMFSLSCPLKG